MAYDIRYYIHCIQHNHSWVWIIKNDIVKLLVNCEYIDFFIQIYEQWSSDNSIKCLPNFEKMAFSQFKVYIEAEKRLNVLCATTVTWIFSFHLLLLKKGFLYFTDVKDPYWSAQVYQEWILNICKIQKPLI